MGTSDTSEMSYDLAKGHINMGGIHFDWDFTDGLTKEQWLEQQRRTVTESNPYPIAVLKSGRIIMPTLNIY